MGQATWCASLLFLGEVRQLLERFRIFGGNFSERFPVQIDFGAFQVRNQSGIGCPIFPASRVNSNHPKSPERAFFLSAVPRGKRHRPLDRLARRAVKLSPSAPKSFGAF